MIKYARITDPEKGILEVGIGDPDAVYSTETDVAGIEKTLYVADFYKSLGMELMEVEQGADGNWYAAGFAPAPPETRTVRTFSKFNVWVATRELPVEDGSDFTVWQAFETFLHEQNLWSGWNQLVDLVEDNPFFEQFYPLACEQLGKELVDQVLAASVISTKEVVL